MQKSLFSLQTFMHRAASVKMGSDLPLAALGSKDRCREIAQTLQTPLPAQSRRCSAPWVAGCHTQALEVPLSAQGLSRSRGNGACGWRFERYQIWPHFAIWLTCLTIEVSHSDDRRIL